MYPLKMRHSYHDGDIRSVEFMSDDCIVFEIVLCGCSDMPGETVHLSFYNIKNVDEVRRFIDGISISNKEMGRLAGILGIMRDKDRNYMFDLTEGEVVIKAKGFTET